MTKACDPLQLEHTQSPREKAVSRTGTRECAAEGSAPTRALGGMGPRMCPGMHVHVAGTVMNGRTEEAGISTGVCLSAGVTPHGAHAFPGPCVRFFR